MLNHLNFSREGFFWAGHDGRHNIYTVFKFNNTT